MSIKNDKYFIKLANNLAKNSVGFTGPNPSVGAVIVKDDKVISFGSTSASGRPHAEANALRKLHKNEKKDSTIYVSLEPCSHFGKSPPCVDNIIASKIKRVVYSINDLDSRTSGKSYKILKSNKIIVKKNFLKHFANKIYKDYFYSKKINKPYVYGKLAISKDFFLKDKKNFYITNNHSLNVAHVLRSKINCIITTYKTINSDNPKLNCRIDGLNNFSPEVAILDKNINIKKNSFLLNNAKNNKTYLFYNRFTKEKINFLKSKKIIPIKSPLIGDCLDFNFILKKLYRFGNTNVLVEGGKILTNSLLNKSFFNEFYLFISSKKIGKNGNLKVKNIKYALSRNFKKANINQTFLDKDKLIHYY
tara:strand:+ start:1043 stop:2128 length:1086 start_codon:yes stop_codon:yes gene_type:complete